ncbi:MAG: hypothetical protein HZA58_10585 [Acidimicrobiia bacterium]|nr:hypothetical protein [Acidimicrobiia bacterium]
MKRGLASGAAVIAIAMTAALASPALAATLGSTSRSLGAGAAAVTRCDSDGLATRPNLSGTTVVSVTVSGIASECEDLIVRATVTGGTSSSGSTVIPSGGGTLTVTLAAAVGVVESMRIDLTVSK